MDEILQPTSHPGAAAAFFSDAPRSSLVLRWRERSLQPVGGVIAVLSSAFSCSISLRITSRAMNNG
jgi:hypothetical protein